MKKLLVLCVIVLTGVLSWGTISAQDAEFDLPQLYTSSADRIAFRYPAGWTIVENDNFVSISDGTVTIDFYSRSLSDSVLQLANDDTEAALALFLGILEIEGTPDTRIELNDEQVIGSFVVDKGDADYVLPAEGLLMEGGMIFIHIHGGAIDLLGGTDLYLAIIDTFGVLIPPTGAGASVPPPSNTGNTSTTTSSAEPCFVRAISDGGTSVHVGPGNNRSVVRYLEANRDFAVIGTAQASDNTRWWRLNKTEAAPSQAAQINETWVADAEVTESGGCESVGTVSAPPIIPIRPTTAPDATPVPTPVPGSNQPFVNFYASNSTIAVGDCVDLIWDVRNIDSVYFEGRGVSGQSSSTECPSSTTTYELRVVPNSGADIYAYVTVTVSSAVCSYDALPFYTSGNLATGGSDYWYIEIDPCMTPTTITVSMFKGSNSIDPFIEVYADGFYLGSDDDGAGSLDSTLTVTLPFGTTEVLVIATTYNQATGGPYDLYVQR